MRYEIAVQAPGASLARCTLAAAAAAGGSRADAVFLPGVAPGGLLLVPAAAGVVVEARVAGVRVGGHPVAPGARRLLRPGERAEIHGAAIAIEGASAPAVCETRVAAAALLRDAAAGGAPIAGARLVVLTGPAAGERHPLAAEQTMGRGRSATIRIPDPQASRVHARIVLGEGSATIEDLRSKNGVRVNGVRLDRRACPVAPGDEILIGETSLLLEDPCPAAPAALRVPGGPTAATPRARGIVRHLAAAALLALSAAALAIAGS